MKCVRCGDPKAMHCKADGSNIRNALCPAFLDKWPDGQSMTFTVAEIEHVGESDAKKAE